MLDTSNFVRNYQRGLYKWCVNILFFWCFDFEVCEVWFSNLYKFLDKCCVLFFDCFLYVLWQFWNIWERNVHVVFFFAFLCALIVALTFLKIHYWLRNFNNYLSLKYFWFGSTNLWICEFYISVCWANDISFL